ncbi:bacteriohemerythrin [Abyssisolibacter fermentans]|uniref:bacteriohemerythrin n=1 Tax=Abyssisolibacter fermentans TaxID=1766203 RepID=UPI000832E2D5|nr:bacteriohemerythrin [Abyssisolibacter fermentans]
MFEWKEEYSVQIKDIDNQHKKLLSIGEELFYIVSGKSDIDHYDEIISILKELEEYTIYHFGYEEALMQKYNYDEFLGHKEEHNKFINKIKGITTDSVDEAQVTISMDIIMFIADWIEHHILKSDHKYKELLKEKINH